MKAKLVSAAAVIVLTLTTGLVSCSKNELTDSSNLTQAVKITKPEKRKFSRSFDTASVAMAVKSAYINPKVAATIKSFNVKEGDLLMPDQHLLSLTAVIMRSQSMHQKLNSARLKPV